MADKTVASADAGDFHFELKKNDDGTFRYVRSDISDPARTPEELSNPKEEIPPQVFIIFNGLMY